MFRHRTNAQQPSDELYENFKANFPHFGATVTTSAASSHATTSLSDALDLALKSRQMEGQHAEVPDRMSSQVEGQHGEVKDKDPTPIGHNEPWQFGTSGLTPSILDPTSHNFSMFSNHVPGYYTPTSGGTNALYHNQAGDLHTPGFGMGLGTPLSMPTSEGTLHAGQQANPFQGVHAQLLHHPQLLHHVHPTQFQNVNPFHMHHTQAFPPLDFTHQPPFEHMEPPLDDSPMGEMSLEMEMQHHHHSPDLLFHPQSLHGHLQQAPLHQSAEKFRFHVTLNAPTAMIKHADEIPVTYLNKGQAYTLNVADTAHQPSNGPVKYRTFVRVSFEDEQQRQRPGSCWQLWKEGRGTNEAHLRGGRLQAVEFVDPFQLGGSEDMGKARMDLECSSFDGFCVTWSPTSGSAECPISVRFNFLSTDFSHSKGVKGIPVRLCSKTEIVDSGSPTEFRNTAEVCYCKVKLFRDHGAERKLSNDVAHIKKTIEKLNQQIAQMDSGMRETGKRKRSSSISKSNAYQRPGKVPKHRRTWSMSSVTSTGGRASAEEDLQTKLITMQDMFTSTRPASVLYLRGAEKDDPDLHPVALSGEGADLLKTDSMESASWYRQSINTGPSSIVSPTPSSNSLSGSRRDSNMQQPTPYGPHSRVNSNEWAGQQQTALVDLQGSNPQNLASPLDNQPTKVQTRSPTSGTLSGWIEAVGVDHTYQAPPERVIKPVACFFVQPRVAGKAPDDNYHRAVYLMQRTLKDFTHAIALKCNMEGTQVLRTVRISRQGLHILFDDDCIHELPDGQDMTAEFCELRSSTPKKKQREWDAGATDMQVDGDLSTIENVPTSGYELKLLF